MAPSRTHCTFSIPGRKYGMQTPRLCLNKQRRRAGAEVTTAAEFGCMGQKKKSNPIKLKLIGSRKWLN